ncbi:cytochrome c oxidase assembly factor CtaG [Domibacillus epiphyticus]|uniref:Cytochrome c oxidase assembly factor CtaG n=1 Tax=Domibacillus epiphyticus TaxID=1714355 RepID=A0A1V2ACQ5_9BACI|nr:cytochrome c oxidase assembly factor CtaG [Domibacillus epiphyticus]OMP68771.1 cytochrome c oxidase assembly factor CtaG [Domibacillus epiphyticus]
MPIGIFGFQALWSPLFIVILLFMTVLFFLLTVKWRKNFIHSEPLTKRQAVLFLTAIVVLFAVKGSPIDLLGHIMMTYHMIQMGILYLVVPPLLIKAIPWWVWKAVIEMPVIRPVFSFATRPLIALIFFNGLFSFYHIPLIFDFIKMSAVLHSLYTVVLFFFAIFMWWPLVNEQPEGHGLHGLKKVGYIFANGILLTPACALIIFAAAPLYATYTDGSTWLKAMELCVPPSTLSGLNLSGPELFSNMPPLEDQKTGGIVMKVIQEIVYGVVLAQVFFEWFRKEEEQADQITEAALARHNNTIS